MALLFCFADGGLKLSFLSEIIARPEFIPELMPSRFDWGYDVKSLRLDELLWLSRPVLMALMLLKSPSS